MKKKGFILLEIIMTISVLSLIIPISFKYIRGVNDKSIARDTKIQLDYATYSIANYLTGYTSSELSAVIDGTAIKDMLELSANFKDNLNVTLNTAKRTVTCTLGDDFAIYKIP